MINLKPFIYIYIYIYIYINFQKNECIESYGMFITGIFIHNSPVGDFGKWKSGLETRILKPT